MTHQRLAVTSQRLAVITPDTRQADMVAMKAREYEQVRFRSVPTRPGDLHLEAAVAPMRKDILDYIYPPGGPESARDPDVDIKQIMDPPPASPRMSSLLGRTTGPWA